MSHNRAGARALIRKHLADGEAKVCITCSFQAEDMVVLDLLRELRPQVPVLFLETGYHFPETYEYRDRMAREWNLNLVNLKASLSVEEQESQLGKLYQSDPGACCQIRKVKPLMAGLEPYDVWFTGLRREQSPTRAKLQREELHRLPSGRTIHKLSPLAEWKWEEVWDYVTARGIPQLPLYEQGYTSIGCAPCTARPLDPENLRSGRWGGRKLECGIHTFTEQG